MIASLGGWFWARGCLGCQLTVIVWLMLIIGRYGLSATQKIICKNNYIYMFLEI